MSGKTTKIEVELNEDELKIIDKYFYEEIIESDEVVKRRSEVIKMLNSS